MDDKKAQGLNLKVLGMFLLVVAGLVLVMAIPTIIQIQPAENITTSNSSVNTSFNILSNGEGISEIRFNWDSYNYSVYDKSTLVFMNFDNRSDLGESDALVRD